MAVDGRCCHDLLECFPTELGALGASLVAPPPPHRGDEPLHGAHERSPDGRTAQRGREKRETVHAAKKPGPTRLAFPMAATPSIPQVTSSLNIPAGFPGGIRKMHPPFPPTSGVWGHDCCGFLRQTSGESHSQAAEEARGARGQHGAEGGA